MTTLFNSTDFVKPTNPRFGQGILATRPTYHVEHSAADATWWSIESARMERARGWDARIDRMANEAAALDALTRGLTF
jgi:hypothetical protein